MYLTGLARSSCCLAASDCDLAVWRAVSSHALSYNSNASGKELGEPPDSDDDW